MATSNPAMSNFLTILVFFHLLRALPIQADSSSQLQILLNLKSALQKSNPKPFYSWRQENAVCNFTGIGCNSYFDVTDIDLFNQKLSGELPLDKICQIQSLQKLVFSFNSLHGRISQDLNNCVRLKYLDLGNNLFTGPFPIISSLGSLMFLYLNMTGISGNFPWKSLANMSSSLRVLSIGDNPLNQSPFAVEITECYNLEILYLSNCSMEGVIPAGIGNLTLLESLELNYNSLSGPIPEEIGKFTNLWQLTLYRNNLTGKLPVSMRNLTNLQFFDASTNNIEGDISVLRFLTNLASIELYENHLTGEVPKEFGEFRHLVNLSLYTNNFTGALPQTLGFLSKFISIDVSENLLTGSIPPDLCKHGALRFFLILQNRFTGIIPENYGNCSRLIRFRVNGNSLSGSLPAGIWGLPNAVIIDLRFNQLEGAIAPNIANAKSLTELYTANNQFSGILRPEIGQASSLLAIDLSYNRFQGQIPPQIGDLKELSSFVLQNNNFNGSIPESIGSCTSLNVINIAANFLSGKIPPSLASLSNLNSLNLSQNRLSGEIPSVISSLKLSFLDLSNNELKGLVPRSLSIDAYNGSFVGNPSLCSDTSTYLKPCSYKSNDTKKHHILIASLLVALAFLLLSYAIFISYMKRRRSELLNPSEETWTLTSFQILSFTTKDILDSLTTENVIGNGGSGEVYKVRLSNGTDLAVKLIRSRSKQNGRSREFEAEVRALSSLRHVNVVKLYCSISSENGYLLVYDYMRNGSLWDRLHTCKKIDFHWGARFDVAMGMAKGLEYLHHGCHRPVIHRDIKSSNILLDDSMNPIIADFGLAKIVKISNHKESTDFISGTPGYFPPEYGFSSKVTEKCDVYCYGVVVMELVTGRRALDAEFDEYDNIVSWVCNEAKNSDLSWLLDAGIESEAEKEEALKVLRISILCTRTVPEDRPTMQIVVKMLEECHRMIGMGNGRF